jgi:predicted lactoylglutathione lyase
MVKSPITNDEFIKKVGAFLDNELSDKESRDLLREIQTNPAFMHILKEEQTFREFIKTKIDRRKPSPALIASIKDKIKASSPI